MLINGTVRKHPELTGLAEILQEKRSLGERVWKGRSCWTATLPGLCCLGTGRRQSGSAFIPLNSTVATILEVPSSRGIPQSRGS